MTHFTVVASALFSLLFLIWTKKDWFNFVVKAVWFFLSVWGAWLLFHV